MCISGRQYKGDRGATGQFWMMLYELQDKRDNLVCVRSYTDDPYIFCYSQT